MSDTTPNKMREEFQSALKDNYRKLNFTIHADGKYIDAYVDTAWIAWKLCAENMQSKIDEANYRALEESNKYVSYCDLAEAKITDLETQLAEAKSAINNVFAVKGRYNTEIAMNRLKAIADEGV